MPLLLSLLRTVLRWLAIIKLKRERPLIIAVTGSVGKTTTKEAIFAALANHFQGGIRKSTGNLNNEEGVPLSILGFDFVPTRWQYPRVILQAFPRAFSPVPAPKRPILVQEISAEKPGDVEYLLKILKPYLKVGVVTSVGPIHLNPGQFSSVPDIAVEKGRLIEALPSDGWAVLNKDNPYTKAMAKRTPARIIWFKEKGVQSSEEIARVIGSIFGLDRREIDQGLKQFARPYGRLHELPGLKGSVLIDDSYNANPMSVEQAIEILNRRSGRRIAALGDMLELGVDERIYHQQIGKLAREKVDVIVGVGKRSRWYQPTYWFATPSEAAHFLKKFVQVGDVVLVKGSQSMRMEIVSEALLAKGEDAAKLPRQTSAWKAKPFIQP